MKKILFTLILLCSVVYSQDSLSNIIARADFRVVPPYALPCDGEWIYNSKYFHTANNNANDTASWYTVTRCQYEPPNTPRGFQAVPREWTGLFDWLPRYRGDSGYAGIYTFDGLNANARTHITGEFHQDSLIQANTTYYASMLVSLADLSGFSTPIGIQVDSIPFDSATNPAQTNNDFIALWPGVQDTSGWTFLADSFSIPYNAVDFAVGNFFDDQATNPQGAPGSGAYAHYFIGFVCISRTRRTCIPDSLLTPPAQSRGISGSVSFTPNPNFGRSFSITSTLSRFRFQIVDTFGIVRYSGTWSGAQSIEIPLPAGLYYLYPEGADKQLLLLK